MSIFGYSIIQDYITEAPKDDAELEIDDLDAAPDTGDEEVEDLDAEPEGVVDDKVDDLDNDDSNVDDNQDDPTEDDNIEVDDLDDGNVDDLDSGDNTSDNMNDDPEEENDFVDEIKKLEDELFSDLSDDQKVIRDKDIIALYSGLYNKIDETIGKLDRVIADTESMAKIDFCSNKLIEVKEILYDYILDTYRTKSYIQNITNYYEFVAIVNSVIKIIDSIKKDENNK